MDFDHLFSSPFFVGAAGALVSLRFSSDVTWWQRAMTFACGTLIAGYVARSLAAWLKFSTDNDVLAIAFAVGLLGLSVIAAIRKGIGELEVGKIITGWISRKE